MDTAQMKMLQILSENVRQNITYNCKNSHAMMRTEQKSYKHPLKLRLDSELEMFTHKRSTKVTATVISDECWVSVCFIS